MDADSEIQGRGGLSTVFNSAIDANSRGWRHQKDCGLKTERYGVKEKREIRKWRQGGVIRWLWVVSGREYEWLGGCGLRWWLRSSFDGATAQALSTTAGSEVVVRVRADGKSKQRENESSEMHGAEMHECALLVVAMDVREREGKGDGGFGGGDPVARFGRLGVCSNGVGGDGGYGVEGSGEVVGLAMVMGSEVVRERRKGMAGSVVVKEA
ncbi:hypothetical protein PIB30_080261 [Stylosanthes scabra]|uniref:Uncharacterized protein n=1 Tax=Stylosanthes scabra TaxID=79078 RepID=A0ABU6XSC1_9FABA|nr:hypothetical protein [Stylosanthes scabra]